MAMIETWVKCELKKAVQVQYLQGNLFSLDNQGNLVGVEVFDEGEPASLSGTVSANVIRADGGTVAVSGTLSGNKCYVVLPQAAYQVPGVVTIVIKLTASSVVTTLAAVVTTVYRSSTETAVDPGTIISDINTLIAEIEAAVATIPADYSSLWTTLAPAYSTSSTYAVGQYVTYNGGLYRCTTAITSGESWTSGHWTAAKLGPDISDLKSAFGHKIGYLIKNQTAENGTDKNLFNIDDAVVGYDIDVNGVLSTNVNRNVSTYIPVNPGDTIYFYYLKTSVTPATSPALKVTGVAAFDINGNVVASAGTHPASSSDRPTSYTVPTGIHYIRVSYINTNTGIMFVPNNSSLSVSETIAYTTPGYIDNYSVRFTDNQNLDDTQKKTARDNIGAMGGDVIQNLRVFDDSNMFDISAASLTSDINVNGVISYNVNRTVSDYIPVNPGDTIYFYKKNAGQTVTSELIPKNIAAYDKNKTIMPSAGQASPAGGNYAVPANVRFIRVSYVNTNTNVMFLQNNGNYPSSAEPESYKAPGYIYEGDWSSVRWMVVGDSLTANNNYAAKHYYDYVKDDTGIQIVNKGSSGDGYARDDWFYTALGTVTSSDFDVCTFFGSGNDLNVEAIWGSGATWEERFGEVTDNGTETVLGYVNRAIDRFIELFPLKKLGIVTPTPWAIYSNPTTGTINGTHMDEYASALVTICKNRGIPCLDLYHESGLRPWLLSFRTEYYNDQSADHSDGVHPGTKGHKWIYPMFREFLKQFIIN